MAMEPILDTETIFLQATPKSLDHDVYRLQAVSQGDNRQPEKLVSGFYYRAAGTSRRPLVVLLPIWGASTYPQRVTLRRLLRGRYGDRLDIVTLDGEEYLFDWVGMREAESPEQFFGALARSKHAYETTVADIRRVLRWAATRPEVDNRRVALVGYSMSAVMGATLIALEPQLHSAALVMTGGRLHEAMAGCPRRPGRARRTILALTGWSPAEYSRELEPRLASMEPLTVAEMIDPARVLYVDAAGDACVPATGREDLWHAMGRPERLILPQNHRNAFLTMTILGGYSTTRRIVRFLERRLFEPAQRPAAKVAAAGSQ